MPRLLITRPQAQAEVLAQLLHLRGFDVLIDPLLSVEASGLSRPPMPKLDALIFTSSNALTFLEERRNEIKELIHLPCYCVGPKTSAAAFAFGFKNIIEGPSDGAALAKIIEKSFKPGSHFLHPGAADTPSLVGQALMGKNYDFLSWPVYRTHEATRFSGDLQKALANKRLDGALFFSPRTASVFTKLAVAGGFSACCQSLTAIGLSQAVSAKLKNLAWGRIETAPEPNETALIEHLIKIFPA